MITNRNLAGTTSQRRLVILCGTVREIVAPTVVDARLEPVDYVFVRIFTNVFETVRPMQPSKEILAGK